jgi:hypothetical protein
MIRRRIIQLRLDISLGCEAKGTNASKKSGCVMPQVQVCIPPIELPSIRCMPNAEALGYQAVLRCDHIVVVVPRKLCPHAVGRLGGFSVTDGAGQNYEVLACVQRLTWTEQLAPE